MPRSFTRIAIAPGIWRDGNQIVARVRVGSSRDGSQITRTKVFPLGTDVTTIVAWQLGERRDLLLTRPAAAIRGTLAADVPIYLATLPEGRYKVDSEDLLAHWIAADVGRLPRESITRLDVIAQISKWSDAGAAVGTCNRRLSRLRKLYHALDGPTVPNPTDAIKFQREPTGEARDIPIRIVKLILDSLPDQGRADRGGTRPDVSKTKLRLTVMAWTGIPAASLARVRPRDLDFKGARIYLRPRRKGKGADGVWIALLPPAVDALRAFVDAGLCGQPWSNSSMRKTWHVGIARATKKADELAEKTGDRSWRDELAALPPRCKPYDLRHSFASEIYRVTGDIRAVSECLQHADLETTKRYTKGAVSERVTAAIAKAADVYASVQRLPSASASRPKPATSLRLVRRSTA
jgi:integrase